MQHKLEGCLEEIPPFSSPMGKLRPREAQAHGWVSVPSWAPGEALSG